MGLGQNGPVVEWGGRRQTKKTRGHLSSSSRRSQVESRSSSERRDRAGNNNNLSTVGVKVISTKGGLTCCRYSLMRKRQALEITKESGGEVFRLGGQKEITGTGENGKGQPKKGADREG